MDNLDFIFYLTNCFKGNFRIRQYSINTSTKKNKTIKILGAGFYQFKTYFVILDIAMLFTLQSILGKA